MLVGLGVVSRDSSIPGIALSSLHGREFFIGITMLTFHLVPQRYFDSLDPSADYVPERFSSDGFTHCTDDPFEMAHVANVYYASDPEPYYYLYIDPARVQAPIRYEDPAHLYPHIYGALNRAAIIAVRRAPRTVHGDFLPPEPLAN